MSYRDAYMPGPAAGANVRKEGDQWTLVLERELFHPQQRVWTALTDPTCLHEWAPFDVDQNLSAVGVIKFSTAGAPNPHITQTWVTRAETPNVLDYRWNDSPIGWRLEPMDHHTRLTLSHTLEPGFISMVAAGWHICLDVLDRFLAGKPIGRIVGNEAMKFDWPRLNTEYAERFEVEA